MDKNPTEETQDDLNDLKGVTEQVRQTGDSVAIEDFRYRVSNLHNDFKHDYPDFNWNQ